MSLQKNIKLLTWFNFFTDFKLYGAIIIIYFAKVTHSYALGASLFSITFILAALFDIPTSIFADRFGRKNTVVLGAITGVLYAVLYAIGTNYWVLAGGAIMEGLSRAFYSGNNNALLHNLLSEEGIEHEYHNYSGKLNAMFQVGLSISAFIGGAIANWSFVYVMWLSVLAQVICLVISLQLVDSKKRGDMSTNIFEHLRVGFKAFISNANLRLLSIDSILGYGIGETFYQFLPAYFNSLLPLWAVGLVRTLSNAGAAAGFYFSGKVIDKLGGVKTLLFVEAYAKTVDFVGLIFSTALSPFFLATTSVGYGLGSVASDTLMQKEFTNEQRATMASFSSFVGSLFYGIFAFLVGLVADTLGIRNTLLLVQIVALPSIFFVWKLVRANKQEVALAKIPR